jgi:hypothetical protein
MEVEQQGTLVTHQTLGVAVDPGMVHAAFVVYLHTTVFDRREGKYIKNAIQFLRKSTIDMRPIADKGDVTPESATDAMIRLFANGFLKNLPFGEDLNGARIVVERQFVQSGNMRSLGNQLVISETAIVASLKFALRDLFYNSVETRRVTANTIKMFVGIKNKKQEDPGYKIRALEEDTIAKGAIDKAGWTDLTQHEADAIWMALWDVVYTMKQYSIHAEAQQQQQQDGQQGTSSGEQQGGSKERGRKDAGTWKKAPKPRHRPARNNQVLEGTAGSKGPGVRNQQADQV